MVDPITGKEMTEAAPPTAPTPTNVVIPKEEWDGLKQRLDVFDRLGAQLSRMPEQQVKQGPSVGERLGSLDGQIRSFDAKIDEALSNGQAISSLLRQRDELSAQKLRLQIQSEDVGPLRDVGLATMDQLTAEITRNRMPDYDVVKDDYEAAMRNLPVDQRMNPQVRQTVYEMAVGKNIAKIRARDKEALLREAATNNARDATAPGRGGLDPGVPRPKDVLPAAALERLREVGKTPDQYYQSLGYKGWADYYTKRKKYLVDEEN